MTVLTLLFALMLTGCGESCDAGESPASAQCVVVETPDASRAADFFNYERRVYLTTPQWASGSGDGSTVSLHIKTVGDGRRLLSARILERQKFLSFQNSFNDNPSGLQSSERLIFSLRSLRI